MRWIRNIIKNGILIFLIGGLISFFIYINVLSAGINWFKETGNDEAIERIKNNMKKPWSVREKESKEKDTIKYKNKNN